MQVILSMKIDDLILPVVKAQPVSKSNNFKLRVNNSGI
jgi:hypothetical protein